MPGTRLILLVLRLDSVEPFWNLALEEYLLTGREEDILLLWQNDNAVVLGVNQNAFEEVNRDFVDEKQVRVVRRCSGGGAVYHDLGNLNFSFITTGARGGEATRQRFTRPLLLALRGLGLAAQADGRNDVTVNGLKVSGNAQALRGRRLLHHGTLLFETNLEVLGRALNSRPEKFSSKSVKSAHARVGNIRDFLPPGLAASFGLEDLAEALLREVERENGARLEPLRLSATELEAIEGLRAGKYLTRAWNYGRSPACNFRNRRKYAGGVLEIGLDIREGKIAACQLQGDFMALRPTAEAEAALCGAAYNRNAVVAALRPLPLDCCFGALTLNEVLDCLFNP